MSTIAQPADDGVTGVTPRRFELTAEKAERARQAERDRAWALDIVVMYGPKDMTLTEQMLEALRLAKWANEGRWRGDAFRDLASGRGCLHSCTRDEWDALYRDAEPIAAFIQTGVIPSAEPAAQAAG